MMTEADIIAAIVKPLNWHKSHMPSWNDDWHTVPTGYTVRCADEWGWKWSSPLGAFGHASSPAAAQAAAEADYRARIAAALDLGKIVALVDKVLNREPSLTWIIENTSHLALDMLDQQRTALAALQPAKETQP